MDDVKCPQIENLAEITKENAIAYIKYVATLRLNQRQYFATRNTAILERCRQMEKELDALNAELLNPMPKLF